MPSTNCFQTEIVVTIGDINYGAHVGNDRFLLFFHEARIRMLQSLGLSELDIGDGVSLIMSEAHVKYKAQVGMAETLVVSISVEDLGKARFTMVYSISQKESEAVVADGWTVMSGFDYQKNKITRLPARFVEALSTFIKTPS